MTAENVDVDGRSGAVYPRFNEAAADDRGKRAASQGATGRAAPGFNEAAADDRGKPRTSSGVAPSTSLLQ